MRGLGRTGLFGFKKKRLIKGETDRENGARLFLSIHRDRTRSNVHELQKEKFWLHIRKKFFVVRVVGHWNRLSTVSCSVTQSAS